MNSYLNREPNGTWRVYARMTAMVTMVSFTIMTFAACVRMNVARDPYNTEAPSVSVSIFNKPRDFRAGGPLVQGVISELYYEKDGRRQLVRREATGSYLVSDLVPGKYQIVADYRMTADGEKEDLDGETRESFLLAEGERASVGVILEKTPVILVVFLCLTVVLVFFLLIAMLEDSDLDLPSLPSPGDLLNIAPLFPPLPMTDDMLWVGMHFAIPPYGGVWTDEDWDEEDEWTGEDRQAFNVFDHSPRNGGVVVGTETDIEFKFTKDVDVESLDHRWIVVTNAKNERIMGGIYYLEDTRTCVYDPLHPLPPNTTVTVAVLGDNIKTEEGESLSRNFKWSFTTGS